MSYETLTLPAALGAGLAVVLRLALPPTSLGELVERLASVPWREADLISETATGHAIISDGEERFTHCALDALLLPSVTGRPLQLRSSCPHCGEVVEVVATGRAIESLRPDAVLSLGVAAGGTGSAYECVCPYINLFPNQRHYDEWVEATPGATSIALGIAQVGAMLRDLRRMR